MNSESKKTSIDQIRETDMISYLSSINYEPVKIRGNDYWYLSPLRSERTASFKVSRRLNRWYDHGEGKGGNLIDFLILYNNCTVGDLLKMNGRFSSFHRPSPVPITDELPTPIKIISAKTLTSYALFHYLRQRFIPFSVAEKYCLEVQFVIGLKQYFAIGFKNNEGGYELRNSWFKGSSSPKSFTIIAEGGKVLTVFEGFINFLSLKTIVGFSSDQNFDFLILNSLSFFDRASSLMLQYDSVHLYLDRDPSGQNCSQSAINLSPIFRDESHLYKGYNDLNDYLVNMGKRSENRKIL